MNRDLKLAARLVAIFLAFVLVCYLWLPLPTVVAQTTVTGGGGGAATSVTAAAFPLLAPNGTAAAPSYSFTNSTDAGIYRVAANQLRIGIGGKSAFFLNNTVNNTPFTIGFGDPETVGQVFTVNVGSGDIGSWNRSNMQFGWSNSASESGNPKDTGIKRTAAGVASMTDGGAGTGWIQNAGGDKYLTANHTNATVTPTNITDLTVTVAARKYGFRFVAQVDNSTDADGLRFDFDGGSAGTTDFRVTCKTFANNAVAQTQQTTALATDITLATLTGTGEFECDGSFEPSGAGTFIPRAAGNTAASGTLTVFKGSWLWMRDM